MKLKSACCGLSDATIQALDTIRPLVLARVVGPHLKRPKISCAGFYVQKCDFANETTHSPFCEVRLTGVSLADDRSYVDFVNAHRELIAIYTEILRGNVPRGQSVVLMIDGQPKEGVSPVIESEEIMVMGQLTGQSKPRTRGTPKSSSGKKRDRRQN